MLTPLDIHNKEFAKGFRGYNESEVDDFLDQVVNDYEALCKENASLKEKLARSERDVEQYKKLEKSLNDTMRMAQQTADEVKSAAKKFSVEIRESAAKECQNMKLRSELECQKRMEEAEQQAKTLVEEAETASRKNLEEAIGKVRSMVAEYDRLVHEKDRFLLTLRSTLETELAILNQAIGNLPHSDADVSDVSDAAGQSADPPDAEGGSA